MGSSRRPTPDPRPGQPAAPLTRRPARASLSSWKKTTAAEGIGVMVILMFVVIARPGGDDAAVAGAPDVIEATAVGADADGSVVLSSGARVHLLGVTFPTTDDPPALRGAAVRGLDRLMQGRRVQIEFDPILPSRMQKNQPVRVAYVWLLGANGERRAMANAMLLSRGLVRPVTNLGYQRRDRFVEAAVLAQNRGAGVWQPRPALPAPGGLTF